ncbi:sce7725 family protein, partial [Staphylococcus aureus]|nr:sce7725 family protein [Staphylococcus aureus]
DDWEMFGDKNKLEMVFVPDDRHIKRKLRNIPNKGIIMDPFNKLSRNVDYLDNDDEFYSDDHLYYKEDGYVAFSDYSVIGGEYVDGGFSPLAIAIHIVYFDEANELRVKHFVSDSNNDRLNPAKKFFEAVDKLVTWSKNLDNKNRSYAIGQ